MPEYDIALELAKLHILKGADFVRQLKMLAGLSIFRAIDNETEIFSTGGEQGEDYEHLLNAARKAVTHGIYKMYDLKTIQGHNSAFNRLVESIGQVNHVLLNITSDYDTRKLASDIRAYFEINIDAVEVLIFKGKKLIIVDRDLTLSPQYHRLFRKRYEK